jgi:hypothetical protein
LATRLQPHPLGSDYGSVYCPYFCFVSLHHALSLSPIHSPLLARSELILHYNKVFIHCATRYMPSGRRHLRPRTRGKSLKSFQVGASSFQIHCQNKQFTQAIVNSLLALFAREPIKSWHFGVTCALKRRVPSSGWAPSQNRC